MTLLATVGAFMRRDWRTAKSYRLPFVLTIVAEIPSLAVFFFIARLVDGSEVARRADLPETGYFAFAAVGVAVAGLIQASLTTMAAQVRTEQTTGTLEALFTTPTRPGVIALGTVAYDMVYAVGSSIVTVVLAVTIFGLSLDIDLASLVGITVGMTGLAACTLALGIALAAFAVVFKDPGPLIGLVGAGIALMSGMYYPVAVLPEPLQTLAEALPFTWGLDSVRSGLLGGELDAAKLIGVVAVGMAAVTACLRLFASAVETARRQGSLAQY